MFLVLSTLIDASVRELQRADYTQKQIDLALATVYGVDTTLIEDGTYFVIEDESGIVACGGWSKRKTLYGGDHWTAREDALLDPKTDAAKIRAFFVRPDAARRGLGTLLLKTCEDAATAAGFSSMRMAATLTGVPFYAHHGYTPQDQIDVPLPNNESLPVLHMKKSLQK